jgi:dipeptide transport system permease protein
VHRSLGLDQPLAIKSLLYLRNIISGNCGRSLQTNTRVVEELWQRFPATVELSLPAFCLAGIASATHQSSGLDSGFMWLSLAGVSMPIF